MTLVASSRSAVGVKVAVQVLPSSVLLTALSSPPSTVRSSLVNPVTGSLKVMVTSEVSPFLRALSASTMLVTVGAWVSML